MTRQQESIFLAAAIRPFVVLFALVGLAMIRRLIVRHFPKGRLKRFLLTPITGSRPDSD